MRHILESDLIFSGTSRRRAALAALVCLAAAAAAVGMSGCDFAGMPAPESVDALLQPDAGAEVGPPRICTPYTRSCDDGQVKSCSPDGTHFIYQSCPSASSCEAGVCRPVSSDCSADENGERPEFSISPTKLVFETSDDLKSQPASLQVTNCTDYPIELSRLEIISPSYLAGQHEGYGDMFVFGPGSSNLGGLVLAERGMSTKIDVVYQPQFAFSHEAATLKMDIRGADSHQVNVALQPKTYCLTATPKIELGDLPAGDHVGARFFVQNCGTEPVELRDIQSVQDADAPAGVAVLLPDELTSGEDASASDTLKLAQGEDKEIGLLVNTRHPGAFDSHVLVEMTDPEKFPTPTLEVPIEGRVVAPTCVDEQPATPTVWSDAIAEQQAWQVDTGAIDEPIHLELNDPFDPDREPVLRLRTPSGSRSQLELSPGAQRSPKDYEFSPDVAGRYRVEIDYVDEDGQPLCEPRELMVDVAPDDDLYVDLQWFTHGDKIPGDVGYGRGVDLNLHVVATRDLSATPDWTSSVYACFGLGELPAPADAGQALRPKPFGCRNRDDGQVHSTIRSLSVSGANHEIITVDDAGDDFYHIGVQAWANYTFPQATAQLTLYSHGERVDRIFLPPQWWSQDDRPEDVDILRTQQLNPRKVWIYGVWDPRTNLLFLYPPRRYPAFP